MCQLQNLSEMFESLLWVRSTETKGDTQICSICFDAKRQIIEKPISKALTLAFSCRVNCHRLDIKKNNKQKDFQIDLEWAKCSCHKYTQLCVDFSNSLFLLDVGRVRSCIQFTFSHLLSALMLSKCVGVLLVIVHLTRCASPSLHTRALRYLNLLRSDTSEKRISCTSRACRLL